MPQLQLTNEELALVTQGIETTIASAQRAQKQGKSPQIIEVYRQHEASLAELKAKLTKASASKP